MSEQATTTASRNEIIVERFPGPITVDHVRKGQFDKPGTMQAQLRQQVLTKSHYPTATISNDMSDNLFDAAEFSTLGRRTFERTENRVTWMTVPEGTTPEQVEAKLQAFPKAIIYKVMSNHPILTDNQKAGMAAGLRSMDQYADSQIVRYGDGATDEETGEDLSGMLILDQVGKPQYKCNFLSKNGKADEDRRTKDTEDFFASVTIANEMGATNFVGQRM
jgi:hypothetical protein